MDSCKFASFVKDGVSLESLNTVASSENFWRVNTNYDAGTYAKHNVKNDIYHELGGNSFMTVGDHVVDGYLFAQARVSKEPCAPKCFALIKLFEYFCHVRLAPRHQLHCMKETLPQIQDTCLHFELLTIFLT